MSNGGNVTNVRLTNEQEVANLIARVKHIINAHPTHPEVKRVIEHEMNHLQGKLYEGHFSPFHS